VLDREAFAALLCEWCLQVEPGQQVLVSSSPLAEPLVVSLHAALLRRGAWPIVRLVPAQLQSDFYVYAQDVHLDGFAPIELEEAQAIDSRLSISAPANTTELAGIDPDRIARARRARQPVFEAVLSGRWAGTQWPTSAFAQQARMSDRDYEAFLRGALFLDHPDPVAAWTALSRRQEALVKRLGSAREVRIEADGTDLFLRVDGRRWINSDGRRNMPSGEVFTGPLEDSANGTIRFTIPSMSRGIDVEGVELTFRDGEVVDARAERGEGYLRSSLAMDAGARFLGELGIGTNTGIDRATGSTLLDEKIAGTVHLALGRSYPETGGTNDSALHWDLICDLRSGGELTVDGEPLQLAGFLGTAEDQPSG
jgi:aminopeptidase